VLDGLGVLVDNSLVRQEPTSKGDVRFRMLETIREFAAERLAESGDRDELPRRHAEQFRDLAEEAEPSLTGEGEAEWLERLVRDHENLRAALDWAESRPDAETALRIAAAMWRFWQLSARLAEGRARLERVLALPGADVHEAPRVRALGALGGILYWQGDYEAMRDRYEQAVDIAREVGQPRLLARALFDLSFAPMTTRNFELAEPLLTEAIARAPEDDRLLQAEARAFLGWLTGLKGDDPAAGIESTEDLIAIRRDRGGRADTAEPLYRLASLKLLAGDETAWGHVRESVTVQLEHIVADAAELPSPAMPATVALAIGGASLLASHNGDHERAARLLGASSRFTDEGAGDPPPSLVEHFGDPEAAARAALGDEVFARAHAEGYAMTTDQVIAYAMEVVARPDG